MTDAPEDPPDNISMQKDAPMSAGHDGPQTPSEDTSSETPKENIVHFNPWRDFNDAAPQIDVFGDEPDPAQIAQFMQVVFGYLNQIVAC